jgi:hypothetical protein
MWRVAALCVTAAGCSPGFHEVYSDLGPADGGVNGFEPVAELGDADVQAGALRAVWGSGQGDVHIAGDNGVIFDWTGTKWQEDVGTRGVDYFGVWGTAPDDVWVVGTFRVSHHGLIMHKTAPGWAELGEVGFGLHGVWGVDDNRWAVGENGAVYGGASATPFAMGIQFDPNSAVPKMMYSPLMYGISGNSATSILVAADVDSYWYYDGTWHLYTDPVDRTRAFRASFGLPSATPQIYIGANYYGLWYFQGKNDPITGMPLPVLQFNEEKDAPGNENRFVWGIWGPSLDKVIAVGDGGRIMTFDRNKGELKIFPSPTMANLYGIWGTSLDDVWIVGDGSLVLHGRLRF